MTDGNTTDTDKPEAENPHAASVRKLANAMLRTAVPPAVLTVAVAAVLAAMLVGSDGLYGALVGGVVAFGSSLLTIAMMKLSAELPVMMVMTVALGGYVFKLVALLVVMLVLKGVDSLHPMSLAMTVLAVIFVWAAAEIVAFKRTKIPTIVV